MNATQILNNIDGIIESAEGNGNKVTVRMVRGELGIIDWWKATLTTKQLKAMKSFLAQAVKMGFDGHACFIVGVKGCTSGMWAYRNDIPCGDFIYRTFQSGKNHYNAVIDGEYVTSKNGIEYDEINTVAKLRAAMA